MAEGKKTKEKAPGKKVGKVEHYYTKIKVGVVKLSGTLKVGDKIRIKGATTDFEQTVDSMQIEQDKIDEAKKGKSIGLKVKDHVRQNDVVYKVWLKDFFFKIISLTQVRRLAHNQYWILKQCMLFEALFQDKLRDPFLCQVSPYLISSGIYQ